MSVLRLLCVDDASVVLHLPLTYGDEGRRDGLSETRFYGLGWDGLMFGASAMWFDSGVFDDNSVFAFVDQHVRGACLLPWRGCPQKCGREAFVLTASVSFFLSAQTRMAQTRMLDPSVFFLNCNGLSGALWTVQEVLGTRFGSTFSAWSMFRLLCDHVLQLHIGLFSGLQVVWARSNMITMTITTVTRTLGNRATP